MSAPIPTPAQLLNRAADVLDERGWHQGSYLGPNGCVCALGAIRVAAAEAADVAAPEKNFDFADYLIGRVLPVETNRARVVSERALEDTSPYGDVALWNDEDGRTKAEVQDMLRRAAEAGEA